MSLLLLRAVYQLLIKKYKSHLLILLCLFGHQMIKAQYHSDFTSGTPLEILYELEKSSCKDTMMWAGIRTNANGNPNLDQIMFGTMKLDGRLHNPAKVFPPNNWNIFKAHPNVELLQIETGAGECNGYMMTVSHTFDGVNYNLHIMRLDENGNKICEASPLPSTSTSEYINEMILDTDGTIVLVGTMDLGTSTELLLIRMDSTCTVLNTKRHSMQINNTDVDVSGNSINHYIMPGAPARYTVAGKADIYSMITQVDYGLNLVSTVCIDINSDQSNDEGAIDLFHQGNVFLTGYGSSGSSQKFTYFAEIDFTTTSPALINLKTYYLSLNGSVPTDMERRNNLNGFIIAGNQINSSALNDFDPYLIKVDFAGNILDASLHNGNYSYGRNLDVERMGNLGYMSAGDLWDTPSSLMRSFYFASTDQNLKTTPDCFVEIPDSVLTPMSALFAVTTEEGPIDDPSGDAIFPIIPALIEQSFCESPFAYDCDSVDVAANISYSHSGLSYHFSSTSTTSSGTITSTEWTITDPTGAILHTSSASLMSYVFPSIDEYIIELKIEVTLADGTICTDETTLILCTEEVAGRTFNITHNITKDTNYFSLGDWAMAGLQNANGDYAVMGHFMDPATSTKQMYFARFDKKGEIIRNPIQENLVAINDSEYDVVDLKQRLSPSDSLFGYLALTNRTGSDNTKRFQLSWLSRSGSLNKAEDFFFISTLDYLASDMVVHGDTAAIVGEVIPSGTNSGEVFFMLYNLRTQSTICLQRIYISNGDNKPTVVEYLGGGEYAIAGTKGNRAFYLEVDDQCISTLHAQAKDVDNVPISLDIPAKIIVTPTRRLVAGTTCENTNHDIFLWNPVSKRSHIYDINSKGSKLSDAKLLNNGNFLLAGSTNLLPDGTWDAANPPKAFMMEVDNLNIQWSNIYDSEEFEVSHISEVDIDQDNGIFATGWSIPLTPNSSITSLLYESNTLILKTDSNGRLYECACYEPVDVTLEEIIPFGSDEVTDPTTLTYDPLTMQFYNEEMQCVEYICDRYCPFDCCIDHCQDTIVLANPDLLPGIYHAADDVIIVGVSLMVSDSLSAKSGGEINMLNGFEITSGDIFISQIESCEACCDMANPLNDLQWLADLPGVTSALVNRLTLEDQCLYSVQLCGSEFIQHYDCNGNFLCESEENGSSDCPNWNILNIETLQNCL